MPLTYFTDDWYRYSERTITIFIITALVSYITFFTMWITVFTSANLVPGYHLSVGTTRHYISFWDLQKLFFLFKIKWFSCGLSRLSVIVSAAEL